MDGRVYEIGEMIDSLRIDMGVGVLDEMTSDQVRADIALGGLLGAIADAVQCIDTGEVSIAALVDMLESKSV